MCHIYIYICSILWQYHVITQVVAWSFLFSDIKRHLAVWSLGISVLCCDLIVWLRDSSISSLISYGQRGRYIKIPSRTASVFIKGSILKSCATIYWNVCDGFKKHKFMHIANYTPCGNFASKIISNALHWRHNEHDGVSINQPHDCLLNRFFRRRSKKTPKLRVTGLCAGNLPWPVNSPHKWPVTRKMFPFDDVIIVYGIYPGCHWVVFFVRDVLGLDQSITTLLGRFSPLAARVSFVTV